MVKLDHVGLIARNSTVFQQRDPHRARDAAFARDNAPFASLPQPSQIPLLLELLQCRFHRLVIHSEFRSECSRSRQAPDPMPSRQLPTQMQGYLFNGGK